MAEPMVTGVLDVDKALGLVIVSANRQNDHKGTMPMLATRKTLRRRTGLAYSEVYYKRLQAYPISDTSWESNPQILTDQAHRTYLQMISIFIAWNWRVKARLQVDALREYGELAGMAVKRRINEEGLVVLGSGEQGNAATLSVQTLVNAKTRINNSDNPPMDKRQCFAVFHSYSNLAVYNEIANLTGNVGESNFGVRPFGQGMTAEAVRSGPMPEYRYGGVTGFDDDNIRRSGNSAKGGVFNKDGVWYIMGEKSSEKKRIAERGGGSDGLFIRSEQAWTIPAWMHDHVYSITAGATEPTF